MEKYADLHIHTTFSDGMWTREKIIEEAKKEGLKAISFTDHDTVEAYFGFDIENRGIEMIKGVEIVSTAAMCPVEVLCYGFDEKDMAKFLKENSLSSHQEGKIKADKEIEVLRKLGIDINFDTQHYDYDKPGNWVIRDLWGELVKIPKARQLMQEEDPDLLVSGKLFFRKGIANIKSKFYVDLTESYVSLRLLRDYCDKNGCVLFLAHPGEYYDDVDRVLEESKNYVDGIEIYHPSNSEALRNKLEKFCKNHNLLISGGSDFHGYRGKLNGQKVPYADFEKIIEKIALKV